MSLFTRDSLPKRRHKSENAIPVRMTIREAFKGKMFINGSISLAVTAVALVIVIAANLLVSLFPTSATKIDLTAAHIYQLSDSTLDYLDTVDQEVTIYLIVEAGSEDDTLLEFFSRYRERNKNIKIETVDPVTKPNFVAGYTNETLSSNSIIIVSGERSTTVDYYDIYVYDYEINYDTYEYEITSVSFDGENCVTSGIKYVTNDVLPTVCFLAGHGETELSDTYFSYLARENIDAASANLAMAGGVPDGIECLVIAGPARDISADEADMIIDYLDGGGRLLLMTDYYPDTSFSNLLSVMEYYGVTTRNGVVLDGDAGYYYKYPYFLSPDMLEHDVVDPLSEAGLQVRLVYAHDITELSLYRDTITVTPLLSSSENSWAKKLGLDTQDYGYVEGDPVGSFNLGVCIEETVGDETVKIIWYGSSSLISDDTNEIAIGANSDLFVNSLAYLSDFESAISIHSKDITVSLLSFTEAQSNILTAIIVYALPLLALAAGITVWSIRRKR